MHKRQYPKYSLKENLNMELGIASAYVKVNIRSAAELKASFLMQVVGMMVNNIAFLVVWVLFFQTFGAINGWTSVQAIALQGFIAIAYGFSFTFFTGSVELPNTIHQGIFDSVLLAPHSVYVRILTMVTRTSAIGDTLYGVILLGIYIVLAHLSFTQIILLFSLLIPSIVILTNFALITSCIGFFIPDADAISKNAFELLFGPSMYPSGVFQGALRIFFLFVIPSIALAGLPVESVDTMNMGKVAIVWLTALIWTLIALWVLKKGMQRYESGNLTGARL